MRLLCTSANAGAINRLRVHDAWAFVSLQPPGKELVSIKLRRGFAVRAHNVVQSVPVCLYFMEKQDAALSQCYCQKPPAVAGEVGATEVQGYSLHQRVQGTAAWHGASTATRMSKKPQAHAKGLEGREGDHADWQKTS